ncbi:MAG: hypothetical protein M3M97_02130 [Actinomycetota bacterium]|nr:hypothetical protein [Actinomycetota bacterium]
MSAGACNDKNASRVGVTGVAVSGGPERTCCARPTAGTRWEAAVEQGPPLSGLPHDGPRSEEGGTRTKSFALSS